MENKSSPQLSKVLIPATADYFIPQLALQREIDSSTVTSSSAYLVMIQADIQSTFGAITTAAQ
jgi:hypothetical protein